MVLEEFLKEWRNAEDKVLVHTSGSTGKPKPMWVEKRRMENSARITCDFLDLKEGDTALLCMPLDYIAGKMVVVRSLVRGLRLIDVKPSGHPLRGLSEVPTFAAMVPMQVYNSMQNAEELAMLKQIKHLIIGGGAIDDDMAKALRSFPNAVWSTYGMTETLSHIALRRLSGDEADEWYTPFDSVEVSLSAENCLVISAPLVCDKELVTNDIAQLSADGRRFRIIGRKDNVIDSGGIKIQIEEVERMLKGHINGAFVITRRKDRKFGEVVAMLLENGDTSAARMACENVLPKYWQPKYYLSCAKLPLTATGKPARAEAERLVNETENLF
ncbi:MAG: AMP-binding protein [Prevotella sp.]|nr:AMP-binding protein [Prevotella sp.]